MLAFLVKILFMIVLNQTLLDTIVLIFKIVMGSEKINNISQLPDDIAKLSQAQLAGLASLNFT